MNKNNIIVRLKRAEGQVKGIQNMVMMDRNYKEILQQVTAVQSAINNVAILILGDFTKDSVEKAIRNGDGNEEVQQLIKVINSFVK